MDALTIQWGWFGGNPVEGPTPPTPPAPADDGDAAWLTSFGRRDLDLEAERYHWQRKANPWTMLRQWLQRFTAPAAAGAEAQPDPEAQRRQWAQVSRVAQITRLVRRRR